MKQQPTRVWPPKEALENWKWVLISICDMTDGFMNCEVRVLARRLDGLQNSLGWGLKSGLPD